MKIRRGGLDARTVASTKLGSRPRAVEILTPTTAFGFQGVKLQPPNAVFSHHPKNVFLSWHFLLDKAENLSQILSLF